MPGVVQQYYEALKEVEDYAQKYGQQWEVREAFDDNLESWRRTSPDDTHSQTVRHAIESTKREIKESSDIEDERESERYEELPRERIRFG